MGGLFSVEAAEFLNSLTSRVKNPPFHDVVPESNDKMYLCDFLIRVAGIVSTVIALISFSTSIYTPTCTFEFEDTHSKQR